MQCFKLPESLCDDIQRLCADFWWGDKVDKKRMHWARWGALCRPKDEGGMGFWDLKGFNQALLAKQLWRMVKYPTSLVVRVFKGRHSKDKEILRAEVKPKCSFVWRSILGSRSLVEKGLGWMVGDGKKIQIYNDRWVTGLKEGRVAGVAIARDCLLTVDKLLLKEGGWNEELIRTTFLPFEADAILHTPVGEHSKEDNIRWHYENNNMFPVKSAYRLYMGSFNGHNNTSNPDSRWWRKHVWNLELQPKVKVFLWRLFRDYIPTAGNLREHHVPVDGICRMCRNRSDSTTHAIFFCPIVSNTWRRSGFWETIRHGHMSGAREIAEAVMKNYGVEEYEAWSTLAWKLWSSICRTLHTTNEQEHQFQ